jgi:hypothetical protein
MRSLRRTLAASVLAFESLVALFAGLVAKDLADLPAGVGLGAGVALMVVCVVAAGTLGRSWGYAVGWAVQVTLVAAGFWVPAMFIVGPVFALLWWVALHQGGRLDAAAQSAAGR